MQTRDNLFEGANGILQRHKLALVTSEDLCDLERLRHETLDLARAFDLATTIGIKREEWMQCELTVSLSSSDNSSIPRIAMMSCSDL